MPTSSDFAAALAQAARTISHDRDLAEILDTIVRTAQGSVPGIDHVGISVIHKDGTIETVAATGELVRRLDHLQYSIDEGPCVSAMRETPVVSVPEIRHEQRWPRFVTQAVQEGLRAQLAVRLFLDDRGTMGGLNLYSTTRDDIDPDAENIAALFAAHAAIAMDQAHEVDTLNQALESRKVIGMAIGIVMERYGIDEHRAFSFLLRASSHENIKLRDIAAALVAQGNEGRTDHGKTDRGKTDPSEQLPLPNN